MKNPGEELGGKYAADLGEVRALIEFDGRGRMLLTRDGELAAEATYLITDDRIEFVDLQGPKASPEAGRGMYHWQTAGRKLIFTVIGDGASGRRRALTAGTWTREK